MDSPALKRSLSNPDSNQSGGESQIVRPAKAKRSDVQAASQRHIKTEQARRDKISAGFQVLQSLLPGREKVEKAMLLSQAAEYITQLQGVLKLLLTSRAISKLPDDLQFQIRTLLPRKDGKPIATVAASPPEPQPQPQPQTEASKATLPAGANLLPAMQLPFVPLLAPAAPQIPELNKDLPQNEGALMDQIQLLLQQQQQQAAAAQQLQSWQQTLQALQLQQVLQQQQQPAAAGQCLPDMMNPLGGFSGAASPLTSLAMLTGQGSMPMGAAAAPLATEAPSLSVPAARRPGDCFADELPKCGLQQLMDAAACEPSAMTGCRSVVTSPAHKARKNVKVRRHTTAARIPKPDHPNPARVGAGRPEPV